MDTRNTRKHFLQNPLLQKKHYSEFKCLILRSPQLRNCERQCNHPRRREEKGGERLRLRAAASTAPDSWPPLSLKRSFMGNISLLLFLAVEHQLVAAAVERQRAAAAEMHRSGLGCVEAQWSLSGWPAHFTRYSARAAQQRQSAPLARPFCG